jgi:hypothetical protein
VVVQSADATLVRSESHGQLFEVRGILQGPAGPLFVMTVWIGDADLLAVRPNRTTDAWGCLTWLAAVAGALVRAEALASLVSAARSYVVLRS